MLNQTSGPQSRELAPSTQENLASIEEEIETSSQFFKPKPGKSYVIKMNPQKDKILPIEDDRFSDTNGRTIRRYECKIMHVNNERQQIWTVSKTVCLQIIEQLRNGFTVLKVTRHGLDLNTIYSIEGVQ